MASSKSPIHRVRHILEEAAAISAATQEVSFETFRDSWVLRRAVEHGLLIISEAAKALPAELKAAYPEISWGKVEALGNFLRHEYRDVDPDIIWRIVQSNVPELADVARRLVKDLS